LRDFIARFAGQRGRRGPVLPVSRAALGRGVVTSTGMGPESAVRLARLPDAPAIKKCVEAAYRHYTRRIGKPPGPMLDDYAEVIRQHRVFVVETDAVVGVLVLILKPAGILLDNVAVHPDQQGKGLGKRLLKLAEVEACAAGFEQLDLYTHACMTENIVLYEALGYKQTERRREQGYERVYMRKHLDCSE